MKPFSITEPSKRLVDSYPPPDLLKEVLTTASREERLGFLRLWVSEGIPYAFRSVPMLYEVVRGWLGRELQVHPKSITIVGSARMGYSLAPSPKYGRPIRADSDLDWMAVAEKVFFQLAHEFYQWKDDFALGRVLPRNDREENCWQSNSVEAPANIAMGFINVYRIPNFPRYAAAQKIANSSWVLVAKLAETPCAPRVRKAPLRVYRDWFACLGQMERSFSSTLQSLQ
jgi:hypothetical protein